MQEVVMPVNLALSCSLWFAQLWPQRPKARASTLIGGRKGGGVVEVWFILWWKLQRVEALPETLAGASKLRDTVNSNSLHTASYVSTQITVVRTLEYLSRLPVSGPAHFSDYNFFDGMKLSQGHPPVYSCNTKLPIFHCENPPIGWLSTQYSFTKAQ
jgi:hypothetical protein